MLFHNPKNKTFIINHTSKRKWNQQKIWTQQTSGLSGLAGFFSSNSFINDLSWNTSARQILDHSYDKYNCSFLLTHVHVILFWVLTYSWEVSGDFWGCGVCDVQQLQMFYQLISQTPCGAGPSPHSMVWKAFLTATHEHFDVVFQVKDTNLSLWTDGGHGEKFHTFISWDC